MLFNTADLTRSVIIKWLASFVFPALLYVLLHAYGDPATLNDNMILFLCVTSWAVLAWAMGTLNDVAVGLILPMLYVTFCGVKQGVVFRPWLGDVAIISIGGFVLGKIMGASGLGKRIALASVRLMGGSFVGAMCGLGIGAAIIAPLVPSIMGKAAIFTAIAVALCDALNFKGYVFENARPADNQRDPVYILEQGEAICGLAGFHFSDAPNQRTEIGYWLLPAYRGKGIVTNTVRYLCQWAVRERNMNRIQIRCAVGNIPSNAIPKRLGFTLEGTEREGELLTSGEYVNVNVYSILKKEIEQWNRKSN